MPERGKFYCSARDVTEAVDHRTALRSSEDEAALREQFIAVVGHDLRNPLAALKSGYALLAKEELSARGQTVIGHGRVTLNRMSRLIDDLMDFARTRLGSGLSLDITSGERLEDAIREVIQEIRIVNPDVSIQSEIVLTEPVPCDVARVSQLLSNLIANAVTHGDISFAISVLAYENADELILEVENGDDQIEPAALAKLFEPFVREEAFDHGIQSLRCIRKAGKSLPWTSPVTGGSPKSATVARSTGWRAAWPIGSKPNSLPASIWWEVRWAHGWCSKWRDAERPVESSRLIRAASGKGGSVLFSELP